jgi:uncharacterized membrane protein YhfC
MIGMPIGLGIFLTRRWKINWRLFWIGALTFVASQIAHIPFNNYFLTPFVNNILRALPGSDPGVTIADASNLSQIIVIALLFGLSAGLFEEMARYITYARFVPEATTWRKGLMLGAGHGGIEAIIFGLLALLALLNLSLLRRPAILDTVPADQFSLVTAQLDAYWSAPLPMTILGAVERALTIPLHLALSLLVMQVFARRQRLWVFFAVFLHTAVNAIVLISAFILRGQAWGVYAIEGMLALFTLTSLGIIKALYKPEPISLEQESAQPKVQEFTPTPIAEARPEDLEDSKYS